MDQQTSTVEPGIPPVKNVSWGLMEAEEPGDMMSQPLWRTVTLGVIQFLVVILTVTGNMLVRDVLVLLQVSEAGSCPPLYNFSRIPYSRSLNIPVYICFRSF